MSLFLIYGAYNRLGLMYGQVFKGNENPMFSNWGLLLTVHTLNMSHQKYVQVLFKLMIFFKGDSLCHLVHWVSERQLRRTISVQLIFST